MKSIISINTDIDKLIDDVVIMSHDIISIISGVMEDASLNLDSELKNIFGSGMDEIDIYIQYSEKEFILSVDNIHPHKIWNHDGRNYTIEDVLNYVEKCLSDNIEEKFKNEGYL